MSTTYTANIVVGLHTEDLEDWAQENDELLDDLFDYFHYSDVYGFSFLSTENFATLKNGKEGELKTLIDKFMEIVGIAPKVMLVVDSY